MFKKTAIAALVLGFSSAASAAMYAPAPAPACAAGNVTVPCERSAWDLGVDALYLRSNDNQYSADGFTAANNNFRAKYGWGFRLEGSYHFGTGNDVTLNWAHYNKGSGASVIATGGVLTRMFRSKFDIVNMEVGQQADFGENFDVRFQGGVQYFNVVENGNGGGTAGIMDTAKGFGPRGGMKVKYDFGNGFGVFGDANAALVVAKVDLTGAGRAYATVLSTDSALGMSYTHAMAQGDLTASLSWGVKQMNQGVGGWDGVSLGLKWVGNA